MKRFPGWWGPSGTLSSELHSAAGWTHVSQRAAQWKAVHHVLPAITNDTSIHTHTPHIWVCVHGSSFSGHASLGLNMALECVCALIQCVCVCVRLHDCPLISTIWAHSLPAVSPVTKRSGWLSAAINNTNKRSAGAGGNHFPPCWNGVSYIFSLGSLLTGSVFVCVLSAGSETFLPRWGNNFWEIKSLNCANRLMRLWKVQSPISAFLLGKKALSAKRFSSENF